MAPCKHPRVQIVAREEDAEFVECMECGEIFESSEFKDMAIEETKLSKRIRPRRVTKVTRPWPFILVAAITIC